MGSSNVSSATNHFPRANEGFTTTLSSGILSGATTVPLTSVSGLTDTSIFVGIIEPGLAKEQTFTGVVDTGGTQITGVVWTRGSNADHSLGVTIVDYVSGTSMNLIEKGMAVNHEQVGGHKTLTDGNGNEWLERGETASAVNQVKVTNSVTTVGPTIEATGDDTNIDLNILAKGTGTVKADIDDWKDMPGTTTYDSNNGARSFEIDVDEDVTAKVDVGMRVRMDRTIAAPTQCYDFEVDDSQYANKASPSGVTFTDDFTCEAWIKVESHAVQGIVSRYDGSNGWIFYFGDTDGTLRIFSKDSAVSSYGDSAEIVPLNEWTHVAATISADTATATIYINGVASTVSYTDGGNNVNAQVGDLEIGSYGAGNFFDGKIAMVRVWDDIRTETEIQDNMTIETPASTTNLVDQWSLDGDLTSWSTNNDLTANGSPSVAAATDNPFSDTEYGIVTAISGTTDITVFTGLDYVVPNDTLTNVQYSSQKAPHGFNADPSRWMLEAVLENVDTTVSAATWTEMGGSLSIPQGAWEITHNTGVYLTIGASVARRGFVTLSSDGSTETNPKLTGTAYLPAAIDETGNKFGGKDNVVYSTSKTLTVLGKVSATGTGVTVATYSSISPTVIAATCAYI